MRKHLGSQEWCSDAGLTSLLLPSPSLSCCYFPSFPLAPITLSSSLSITGAVGSNITPLWDNTAVEKNNVSLSPSLQLRLSDPADPVEKQCCDGKISVDDEHSRNLFASVKKEDKICKNHWMFYLSITHTDPHAHTQIHTDENTLNTSTNQAPITKERLSHMGTKLPSSNWSAEEIAKQFTSAGIHTHTCTHTQCIHTHAVTQSQSVQSPLSNVHSSIHSFIHLLSPGSSFAFSSIGPITTARDPNPWNRTSTHGCTHTHTHTHTHTDTHKWSSTHQSPAFTVTKPRVQAFLAYWYLSCVFLVFLYVCVYVCVDMCVFGVGWFPIRSSRCAAY